MTYRTVKSDIAILLPVLPCLVLLGVLVQVLASGYAALANWPQLSTGIRVPLVAVAHVVVAVATISWFMNTEDLGKALFASTCMIGVLLPVVFSLGRFSALPLFLVVVAGVWRFVDSLDSDPANDNRHACTQG